MERWHSASGLARDFNESSEGAFAEMLLPYIIHAASHTGDDANALQLQLQLVVRDKKQVNKEQFIDCSFARRLPPPFLGNVNLW